MIVSNFTAQKLCRETKMVYESACRRRAGILQGRVGSYTFPLSQCILHTSYRSLHTADGSAPEHKPAHGTGNDRKFYLAISYMNVSEA